MLLLLLSSVFFVATAEEWLAGDFESFLAASSPQAVSPQGLVIVRRWSMVEFEESDEVMDRFVLTRFDDDDFRASGADFECPCGEDVMNLCSPDVSTTDDFASVYEKRLCLARLRGSVSAACTNHLAEAPTVVEYCYEDIEKNCADVEPGENRIHACLASAQTLTAPCADYVRTVLSSSYYEEEEEPEIIVDEPSFDLTIDSIIQASFSMMQSFFQDDDSLFQYNFYPPSTRNQQETIDFFPPVDAESRAQFVRDEPFLVDQKPEEAVQVEEVEDDETTRSEEEEEETQPVKEHAACLSKILRQFVICLFLASSAVAAFTLVSYARRQCEEKRQRDEFKQKFAPLLVESNNNNNN